MRKPKTGPDAPDVIRFHLAPHFRTQILEAAAEHGECLSVWVRDAIRTKLSAEQTRAAFNPNQSDETIAA